MIEKETLMETNNTSIYTNKRHEDVKKQKRRGSKSQ
jgi:hypothetical protein